MSPRNVALAITVAVIWGVNFAVIKIGLEYFPPLFLSATRFFLVAVPAVFFVPRPRVEWHLILALGLVLGVIKFSLLFVGMDWGVGAGAASLLLQTQIFFTIMLAALRYGERPRALQIAGIAVGFLGVALLTLGGGSTAPATATAMVIGAGAAWACANMIMRRIGAVNVLGLMVWMSLIPPLPLFLLSYVFEPHQRILAALTHLDLTVVLALAYTAFLSTLAAYAIWAALLRAAPAHRVVPFTLLVPLVGAAAAALLLGEPITRNDLIAGLLAIAGLAIATFDRALIGGLTQLRQSMRAHSSPLGRAR
jgi:O-acetylserine/cysteine efflux transporter